MKDRNPLVSIIVVTYNSAKYVLETLESAKAQTYPNIELIVSDDGSQDNTIKLCKEWLRQNEKRFIYCELISVEKNTGTPANCNRGVLASSGKWIKIIAGDDILHNDAISSLLNFAIVSKNKFVVSDVTFFNEKGIIEKDINSREIHHFFFKEKVKDKYKSFLRYSVFLLAPTFFYAREVYDKNGGFDEECKLVEDRSFILKTLGNGINIEFLNKKTVKYRVFYSEMSPEKKRLLDNDQIICNNKYVLPVLKKGNIKDSVFFAVIYCLNYAKKRSDGNITFLEKLVSKIYHHIRFFS
ncbi:hypothetical protein CO230_01500 [Chryseobacterium sp. 6424]|uniref:glycosyltransferase n=1 Tax=Chryseobacterium sp. 6424 TaxID=2039166 RepID=UPI000EFCC19E|nr:glycosyltransferase [Chryseobacterium sp. 6424]AYO56919.1 hypothetical protein CO230_01500 [Chryseobacterium sp. 6424]